MPAFSELAAVLLGGHSIRSEERGNRGGELPIVFLGVPHRHKHWGATVEKNAIDFQGGRGKIEHTTTEKAARSGI